MQEENCKYFENAQKNRKKAASISIFAMLSRKSLTVMVPTLHFLAKALDHKTPVIVRARTLLPVNGKKFAHLELRNMA